MITKEMSYQEMANAIHAQNVAVGWWDAYLPGKKWNRYRTAMMLTISELAEAMEGHRKNLTDDHLPDHAMFHVEMADTAIRLLDMVGAYEIDLTQDASRMLQDATLCLYGKTVPEQLFQIAKWITLDQPEVAIGMSFQGIVAMSIAHKFDLAGLICEKNAYNRERFDHKRAARGAVGGKAY